ADRLAMRQIKDILRLKHDAGLSLREIACSLNLSVGVVSKYLQLAAAAGVGWPPPTELDEDALARKLQPPPANLPTTPLPDFAERHAQFVALEKPSLKPLPLQAYECAEWKKARVHIDYHIEVDGHYYSVPHSLIKRQLDVRITATAIECFLN